MTTETTTIARGPTGARPCRAGSATEGPCWRPATERYLGEEEPTLCAEHMLVRNRAEAMDGYLHALEATRGFRRSSIVENDDIGVLSELAIGWYDEVTEKAAEAAHKLRVAEFLAARGAEDSVPEPAVMRELEAHLHVRSDALTDAFTTLIDERELSETERLATIAAIKDASKQVNAELGQFRRERGLRD